MMTRTDIVLRDVVEPEAALLWLLGRAHQLCPPGEMIGPNELLHAALERPSWLGLTEPEAGILRARLEELPSPSRRSRCRQRRSLDMLLNEEAVPGSVFAKWHSMLVAALSVPGPQLVATLDHRPVILLHLRDRASIGNRWRWNGPRLGRRTPHWAGRARRSWWPRAQAWFDRFARRPLDDLQRTRDRMSAWLALAPALPGVLIREGIRIALVRGGGGSLTYRMPVEAGGLPAIENWSARPSVRLALHIVPSLVVLVVGLVGALGMALGLGLGVNLFPVVSLISLGDESQVDGPGMLLVAMLMGDQLLLRWTTLGLLLAWLPTYQAINELSWSIRAIPVAGPLVFWGLSPIRAALWGVDVVAEGSPILRVLMSGVTSTGLFVLMRAWLRTV